MARSHLWEVKRGYWSHTGHALGLSWILLRAGMAGVVHAFVPQLFVRHMSKSMDRVKHLIAKDKTRVRTKKRKD